MPYPTRAKYTFSLCFQFLLIHYIWLNVDSLTISHFQNPKTTLLIFLTPCTSYLLLYDSSVQKSSSASSSRHLRLFSLKQVSFTHHILKLNYYCSYILVFLCSWVIISIIWLSKFNTNPLKFLECLKKKNPYTRNIWSDQKTITQNNANDISIMIILTRCFYYLCFLGPI